MYVGDNGPWHFVLDEEVGPAFEKATGIKIDYTLLPTDPWQARLKTELGGASKDIDIVQWSVGMAGWISPHMLDHEALAQEIAARDPSWDWNDFLAGSKRAATYEGTCVRHPLPRHHRHHALPEGAAGAGRHHQAARDVRRT